MSRGGTPSRHQSPSYDPRWGRSDGGVRTSTRSGAFLVLLLLTAGCASAAGTVTPEGSLAALAVIDTRTTLRPVTAEVFEEAEDGVALHAGDTLRTDETGFAEVAYADGSLTRLGSSTVFSVVELAGDVTVPEITVDLDVGRVWNRVNTVTGERGRFEVVTDVGTAAVRGTAFSITCTPEPICVFAVTEGLVVVTTPEGEQFQIAAGERVTLGRDADDAVPTSGEAGGSDGGGSQGGGDDGGGDDSGGTAGDAPGAVPSGTGTTEIDRDGLAGDDALELWLARNEPMDGATRRFATAADQACSVTVGGRNVDHATTPETAIDAPIDEVLVVDAVATGPLERYVVDLHLAGLSVRAAEGEVLADRAGDRTGFRGEIDVSEYAEWGVGLYEVTAATTGTNCRAHAFVNVTGRSPLATATGFMAMLLALLGAWGLAGALNLALSGGTPPQTADGTTSWTTRFFGGFGGG